jgi:hypothetical protein
MTALSVLSAGAEHPDRPALVMGGAIVTFSEVAHRASCTLAWLEHRAGARLLLIVMGFPREIAENPRDAPNPCGEFSDWVYQRKSFLNFTITIFQASAIGLSKSFRDYIRA